LSDICLETIANIFSFEHVLLSSIWILQYSELRISFVKLSSITNEILSINFHAATSLLYEQYSDGDKSGGLIIDSAVFIPTNGPNKAFSLASFNYWKLNFVKSLKPCVA